MTNGILRRSASWGRWHHGTVLAALLGAASPATTATPPVLDYLTAPFSQERILDWGNRPNWSPDGKRLVFTKDDLVDSPAYEIDIQTRKVRCLTCNFGENQFVTRIFYLPDHSFLIEATPGMVRGAGGSADAARTQLYWMSKSSAKPVSLGTGAMGDIAIRRTANPDGSIDIAWSRPRERGLQLVMGKLEHAGNTARLTNVQVLYDYQLGQPGSTSFPEAYEFMDGGKSVMFWTVEPATLDSEMYKVDIASKAVSKVYATPAHNETHLFPDERYGLEEANFVSDPDGPFRGVSALGKEGVRMILEPKEGARAGTLAAANSDKGFDLYVITMDGKSRRPLTMLTDSGAQAHQSIVAPDGRRIAFAVKDAKDTSRKRAGLYIGTFAEMQK